MISIRQYEGKWILGITSEEWLIDDRVELSDILMEVILLKDNHKMRKHE